MGLFSRLRNAAAAKPDATIARAVLTPAVSTMVADGDVDASELAQLSNLCGFSPIFFEFDGKSLSELVAEIITAIKDDGHEPTIARAAETLSPALRETAMCFAIRLALADGRIDDGEKASLSQTGHHMQIDPETFTKMLDVIAMMQRPATA